MEKKETESKTKTTKKFYIKERHNPQREKPYYVAEGQLSKKAAKEKEKAAYGSHTILPYDTLEEYNNALTDFRKRGFNVY